MPRGEKQSSEAAFCDGLRGEVSVTDLCRREGIASNLWAFLKTLSVARCEPR